MPPDFRKAFDRVRNQVVMGNAHLDLWKGLSRRLGDEKRLVVNTAPTFFGLTLESHLNAAFLYAAKVFDTHRSSLTLRAILRYAEANKGGLSAEASREVERIARESDAELTKLESSLKAVRTRRNKLIAHLDPAVVSKPGEIAKQSQLTVDDLQNVFVVAWRILNGVSVPYWEFSASLKLMDVDDFEHALNLIEREKHRQLAEYEAMYGPFPGG
jgi:hypothetical protein